MSCVGWDSRAFVRNVGACCSPARLFTRTGRMLWSRLASRVLLSLGQVDADTADALYQGVRDIAWEDHVRADGTIAVDASGVNSGLRNTQFTAVRVKDAIADRFRDQVGCVRVSTRRHPICASTWLWPARGQGSRSTCRASRSTVAAIGVPASRWPLR